jgi:hypothetical protein
MSHDLKINQQTLFKLEILKFQIKIKIKIKIKINKPTHFLKWRC